jgi:hypothetical protein
MIYNEEAAEKNNLKVVQATFKPRALTLEEAAKTSGKSKNTIHMALKLGGERGGLNGGVVKGLSGKLVLIDQSWKEWIR